MVNHPCINVTTPITSLEYRYAAQCLEQQKQEALDAVIRKSARVIYIAQSSELAITVFSRLVDRVEQSMGARAPNPTV